MGSRLAERRSQGGFLSAADANPEAKRLLGTYPSEERPGFRVMVPNPRYLFAMKCRAMRIGGVEESQDLEDIRNLACEIGITSATQALELVSEFYPDRLIRPKTRFGLEEMLGTARPNHAESLPGSGRP